MSSVVKFNEGPLLLPEDPIDGFKSWFDAAVAAQVPEPTAMTLATVSKDGKPSARVVLYKGIQDGAFRFVTNYQSRKAQELSANPNVALVFLWPLLHRQVRVEGVAQKFSSEEAEAYFRTRPRGSQLGAWSSPQSQPIQNRDELVKLIQFNESRFEGVETIPCPPFWGGFRVQPQAIEFWEERAHRVHERIRFTCHESRWTREQLAP
jgi:pyridoxamine 5'-phosphate oxidase